MYVPVDRRGQGRAGHRAGVDRPRRLRAHRRARHAPDRRPAHRAAAPRRFRRARRAPRARRPPRDHDSRRTHRRLRRHCRGRRARGAGRDRVVARCSDRHGPSRLPVTRCRLRLGGTRLRRAERRRRARCDRRRPCRTHRAVARGAARRTGPCARDPGRQPKPLRRDSPPRPRPACGSRSNAGAAATPFPPRSAIVGAALAVVVVVSTLVFGASLHTLVTRPPLYGWNWDYELSGGGGVGNIPQQQSQRALAHDSDVAAWSDAYFGAAQIDGIAVPGFGTNVDPQVAPPLLSGHGLEHRDQIVLGANTLAQLHRHLGDTVSVDLGSTTPLRFTIVGTATMPAIGGSGGGGSHLEMGTGALIAYQNIPPSLRDIAGNTPTGPQAILVRFRPGADPVHARRGLDAIAHELSLPTNWGVTVTSVQRPAEIVNYRSMSSTPLYLGAALAAGAVVALALTLVTSVRRRRHDLALLKTFGFTRRQLAGVVAWQSMVAVAIGTVVGIPLGIVIGRALWDLFARQIHVVPEPTVPAAAIAVVGIGALILAHRRRRDPRPAGGADETPCLAARRVTAARLRSAAVRIVPPLLRPRSSDEYAPLPRRAPDRRAAALATDAIEHAAARLRLSAPRPRARPPGNGRDAPGDRRRARRRLLRGSGTRGVRARCGSRRVRRRRVGHRRADASRRPESVGGRGCRRARRLLAHGRSRTLAGPGRPTPHRRSGLGGAGVRRIRDRHRAPHVDSRSRVAPTCSPTTRSPPRATSSTAMRRRVASSPTRSSIPIWDRPSSTR